MKTRALLLCLTAALVLADADDEQVINSIKPEVETLVAHPDAVSYSDTSYSLYYAEHLLAAWVVDKAPWNAYHSGIHFVGDAGDRHTFSYQPAQTASVTPYIVPTMKLQNRGVFKWASASNIGLEWKNAGHFSHHSTLPKQYTDKHLIASNVSGQVLKQYAKWAHAYLDNYPTFEPQEVVVDSAGNITVHPQSSMCHDFVTNSLWWLYELHQVTTSSEEPIFRDHIVVFANSVSEVDAADPAEWASVVEYFSTYQSTSSLMADLSRNFLNLSDVTALFYHMERPLFVYANRSYFRVELTAPVSQYCYLPFAFPPARANIFSATHKLCTPKTFTDLKGTLPVWQLTWQQSLLSLYQWKLRFEVLASPQEWYVLGGGAMLLSFVCLKMIITTVLGYVTNKQEGKAKVQ